jgi:hypothetical protein
LNPADPQLFPSIEPGATEKKPETQPTNQTVDMLSTVKFPKNGSKLSFYNGFKNKLQQSHSVSVTRLHTEKSTSRERQELPRILVTNNNLVIQNQAETHIPKKVFINASKRAVNEADEFSQVCKKMEEWMLK